MRDIKTIIATIKFNLKYDAFEYEMYYLDRVIKAKFYESKVNKYIFSQN